jgi:hypothetical protein
VEYEELEKAVTHKWILSTSKVKELIGVTPRVGKDEQIEFHKQKSADFKDI